MCIETGYCTCKSKLGIHPPEYCWPTGWFLIIGNNTQAWIGIHFHNLPAVTFMDRQRIALEVQSIMTTLETMMMIYILKFHCWFSKTRTEITQFVRISPGRSKLGIHPPRETPSHRSVPDFENQHASEVQSIINIVNNTYNNYGNLEILWWCSK